MKKALSFLFLIGLLAFVALPVLTIDSAPTTGPRIDPPPRLAGQCTLTYDLTGWAADAGLRCPAPGTPCPFAAAGYDCAACCLVDVIYRVSFWLFAGIIALVVIFVLLGAYHIITAAGSPEKVTTGRNFIIWAAIGSVVALLARLIPDIVRAFLRIG